MTAVDGALQAVFLALHYCLPPPWPRVAHDPSLTGDDDPGAASRTSFRVGLAHLSRRQTSSITLAARLESVEEFGIGGIWHQRLGKNFEAVMEKDA